MKYLSILGSTGSIGKQTLEIVSFFPQRFKVVALGAGKNLALLKEQIIKFRPEIVCVFDKKGAEALKAALPPKICKILYGEEGYEIIATYPKVNIVVLAMVGISGLRPTIAALKTGKTVALANKETLVTGGSLVKKAIYKKNQLFPLDSEHSAIYQLLVGQNKTYLKRIILTASGGPLWEVNRNILSSATPKQALTHPRWSMGTKISIDSATMMNKGLEVIETMWLFDIDLGNISIIIHPQSIVHSLIELNDGVILAHLGPVDMHLPIAYALNHPKRVPLPFQPLDLTKEPLTFFPPDLEKFPCLGLALRAAKIGGSMPVVLNATNEIAVEAFLEKKIKITDIAVLVETNMEAHIPIKEMDLETIFSVDKWARVQTHKELQKLI